MKTKHPSFDLMAPYSRYLPGIKGMFAILGMFMVGACLGNLVMLILQAFTTEAFTQNYGTMIIYPIQFIPVMLFASSRSLRNELTVEEVKLDDSHFSIGKAILTAFACALATLCAAFVAEPATTLLPPMPDMLKQVFDSMMNAPLWATLICVAVFAPFFEEWMCRGIIMRGLLSRMKPVWAIVISALFFAFIHLNPWQAIPAFLLGCLFGFVYYKTGSLKLTMLMHCVNNATSVLATKIPGVGDAENFWDIIPSQTLYWAIYFACLLLLAAFIFILKGKNKVTSFA